MTHSTQPGTCPPDAPTILPLPPTVPDALDDKQLKRLNVVLLEFARDTAARQRRAYAAILEILGEPGEEEGK